MVDEMRHPQVYESAATKAFRQEYLLTQNLLRQPGIQFHRHYAASSVYRRPTSLEGCPQRHGFLEVSCVETLGEPVVSLLQALAGGLRVPLVLPEPAQAHSRP
jgi:hypothetical protein